MVQIKRLLFTGGKLLLFLIFVLLCLSFFDGENLKEQVLNLFQHPLHLIGMSLLYGLAFFLRAFAWKWYINKDVPFAVYLNGLFYSLFINHILPVKVGDAIRIGFLAKEKQVEWDEAIHSVVVLRTLDLLVLASIAGMGVLLLGLEYAWGVLLAFLLIGCFLIWGFFRWGYRNNFIQKHIQLVRSAFSGGRGLAIVSSVAGSWILEAFVVLGVTFALSIEIPFWSGLWVNSMTIAGQLFHFAPGGLGTYESVMTFSLVTVGINWQHAYEVALLSHGFKFVFSYLVGLWVWIAAPVSWAEMKEWINSHKKGTKK